jgi:hypothetical protein
MKKYILILVIVALQVGVFEINGFSHPASGIAADKYGNIYFIHSRVGVVKISVDGKLTYIRKTTDGHWLCLDEQGIFSQTQPTFFERITPDGIKPAIIYAGGGSPIAINKDGNFYYCGGQKGDLQPGAKTLVRETPDKKQIVFSPGIEKRLDELSDGITGIAIGPDSSIILACWNSLLKVTLDGKVITLVHPVSVSNCDEDPADHKDSNKGVPLLRGLDVDSNGTIYVAATSCHCVLRVGKDGVVKTILKVERPWSPTGVALWNGNIYILEYTNANGPATEGWFPRVQKIAKDGSVTTIADLSTK